MGNGGKAVGIDLGTTYSCVGVWLNDHVEIIANDQGNQTTLSYVAFTDMERLIGDAAKNQVAMNPHNTVFDAKRLIGRRFSDPSVQANMKLWPFKVVPGPGDKPMIMVQYKGEEKKFSAEEISSMTAAAQSSRCHRARKPPHDPLREPAPDRAEDTPREPPARLLPEPRPPSESPVRLHPAPRLPREPRACSPFLCRDPSLRAVIPSLSRLILSFDNSLVVIFARDYPTCFRAISAAFS